MWSISKVVDFKSAYDALFFTNCDDIVSEGFTRSKELI